MDKRVLSHATIIFFLIDSINCFLASKKLINGIDRQLEYFTRHKRKRKPKKRYQDHNFKWFLQVKMNTISEKVNKLTVDPSQQHNLAINKRTQISKPLQAFGMLCGSIEHRYCRKSGSRYFCLFALIIVTVVAGRQLIIWTTKRPSLILEWLAYSNNWRCYFYVYTCMWAFYAAMLMALWYIASDYRVKGLDWLLPFRVSQKIYWIRLRINFFACLVLHN